LVLIYKGIILFFVRPWTLLDQCLVAEYGTEPASASRTKW